MSSNVPVDLPGSAAPRPEKRRAHRAVGEHAVDHARSSFPGPTVTGVSMLIGPPLALVASLIGAPAYHAMGADFVAGMVEHARAFEVAIQLSLASMMLLIIAVIGMASMICVTRPRWGRVAGVVTMIGLLGPLTFQSVYWAASHLVDTAAHRAAAAVLIDESQVIPRTVMNVSGPAIILGFVLLAIASAKSGVLPRTPAVLLGLTALIPFGFISGHLVISAIGFAAATVALVPLGVSQLRRP